LIADAVSQIAAISLSFISISRRVYAILLIFAIIFDYFSWLSPNKPVFSITDSRLTPPAFAGIERIAGRFTTIDTPHCGRFAATPD